ncbi:MAG: glycosyltransferase family 2 protein [Phycisphaeraceae bacterium]|nr:glycosyltransferase family 2 protein [Phycisphaeraceae bacterium]
MSSSFAIIYSVRNEAELLPDAVRYHRALGCRRFFIFWDRTTDDAPQMMMNLPDVECRDSIRPEEISGLFGERTPTWFEESLPRWDINHDVRKRINTAYAAKRAHELGIEWLVGIDPDELIYVSDESPMRHERFTELLAGVDDYVDQVFLRNLEVVPTSLNVSSPFTDCNSYFKRFIFTDGGVRILRSLFYKLTRSFSARSRFEHWLYRLRFGRSVIRPMRHPITQMAIPRSYYLGYLGHKSIVRASRAASFKFNIHRWRAHNGQAPQTVYKGNVLHYDLCRPTDFKRKFRDRQSELIESQRAFTVRYELSKIARDLPDEVIDAFFRDNIAITDAALLARLQARGVVSQTEFPARTLAEAPPLREKHES